MTNAAKESLCVTIVAPVDLRASDLSEWEDLFELQAAPSNPFLSPTWVLGWYRQFSQPDDQRILFVRHSITNTLIGVAPMHRQAVRVGPIRFAHRLVMVGMGIGPNPFELPGFLARAHHSRDVARAIVHKTLDSTADWCELAVDPNQGWFEPEWTYGKDRPATFSQYQRPKACVILALAPTWVELRSSLKRNVKESLRRSQNRLSKSGRAFAVKRQVGDSITPETIRRFLDLHRMRSDNDKASVHHLDAFADPRNRELILSVLPQLALEGRASIIELEIEGKVLASQLVLLSPGSSYVHSSGFDPEIWSLGPVTYLHAELIKAAIERGDSIVNFSPGPNVSKLRWSEQLWVTNEFAYGSGARVVGFRFGAYQAMSAVRASISAIGFVRKSSANPAKTQLPFKEGESAGPSSVDAKHGARPGAASDTAESTISDSNSLDCEANRDAGLSRVSAQV